MLSMRYTRTAMLLHWVVALGVIVNLTFVWLIGLYPDRWVRPAIDLHKSIGLTVLGLALLRVLWRLAHPPPPLPDAYPARERRLAGVAHLALYALILAMPLSGWIHDSAFAGAAAHPLRLWWVIPFFRIGAIASLPPAAKAAVHARWFGIHADLAYVLYGVLALHLLGVLKHELLDRDHVLARMLPARWARTAPGVPGTHGGVRSGSASG